MVIARELRSKPHQPRVICLVSRTKALIQIGMEKELKGLIVHWLGESSSIRLRRSDGVERKQYDGLLACCQILCVSTSPSKNMYSYKGRGARVGIS